MGAPWDGTHGASLLVATKNAIGGACLLSHGILSNEATKVQQRDERDRFQSHSCARLTDCLSHRGDALAKPRRSDTLSAFFGVAYLRRPGLRSRILLRGLCSPECAPGARWEEMVASYQSGSGRCL